MSSVTKKSASVNVTGRKVRKGRKVTFTVVNRDGIRVYTPVNKRAKAICMFIEGEVNTSHVKGIKKAGYRPYMWVGEGTDKKLVSIKF